MGDEIEMPKALVLNSEGMQLLLDRPIAYHRVLAEAFGSITAAIMLGQAIYWSRRTEDGEGWFWKTAEQWESETYLSRHEQSAARKALAGVLESKRAGVPAKCYFRVNYSALLSRLPKFGKQVRRDTANKYDENRHTLNNAETTTESTTREDFFRRSDIPFPSDELPPPLNTPEIQDLWDNWQEHRRETGNKLSKVTARQQVKELRDMGAARAAAALRHSISKGWSGIFEPKASDKKEEAKRKVRSIKDTPDEELM